VDTWLPQLVKTGIFKQDPNSKRPKSHTIQKLDTESNCIEEGDEKNVNPDEAVVVAEEDDDDLTETFEDALATAKAGKWAQKLLKVQSLDSLWYDQLGETYLALFEQKPAMDAFTEAIKLEHQNWRCFEGLVNAFAEKDNLRSAISEMEKAGTSTINQRA
jgi:tetratricopeptide (TPR) repeat protein